MGSTVTGYVTSRIRQIEREGLRLGAIEFIPVLTAEIITALHAAAMAVDELAAKTGTTLDATWATIDEDSDT